MTSKVQVKTFDPDIPYSQEAEEALLGSILLDPECFENCKQRIGGSEAFCILRNATIWMAMDRLHAEGQPLGDPLILADHLKARGELDEIGGPAFLTQLVRNTPTSTHAEVYAGVVKSAAVRRTLLNQADALKLAAMDLSLPAIGLGDFVDSMQETALSLTDKPLQRAGGQPLAAYLEKVETARATPQKDIGIPHGITDLVRLLPGFLAPYLHVVAGLTHMGKTGTMISMALHAAQEDYPIGWFNVADGNGETIIGRMIAQMSKIAPIDQITGNFTETDYARFLQQIAKFHKLPIYIEDHVDDPELVTPAKIAVQARRMKQQYGVRIIFIDYFQNMQLHNSPAREIEKYNRISQLCVKLGKSLDLPVVLGAQIGHHVTERKNKRPTIHDIKSCKKLSEDADVVMLLHSEWVFDACYEFPNELEIIVGKNKVTGQLGMVGVYLDKKTGAIYNGSYRDVPYDRSDWRQTPGMSPDSPDDIPF